MPLAFTFVHLRQRCALDDEITPDDLKARQIERDCAGPHCPTNILAALMASAKLSLVQEAISRIEAQRNERLKTVRLKSRRARELMAFRHSLQNATV